MVPFKWSPPGRRAGPQGRGSGSSIDRVYEIPEQSEMTGFTRSLDTFQSLWTFEDWLFPHHPGRLRASGCPHPSMWDPASPLPNSCPPGPDLLFPLFILGMQSHILRSKPQIHLYLQWCAFCFPGSGSPVYTPLDRHSGLLATTRGLL